MPFAQYHYPFQIKDIFEKMFPAKFIAEGVDQTRGWFFTLHAISIMLFGKVSYENVISNGLVLDKDGNIAAATSTGGMTNKMPGRVGDTPIIGSGTWAQNDVCGVSSTGHGEFFIKYQVAKEVCTRIEYLNETLEKASSDIIEELLTSIKKNISLAHKLNICQQNLEVQTISIGICFSSTIIKHH